MEADPFEGWDPSVIALMEICHAQAHEAESNVEDGVLISLTKREVWLNMLAHLLLSQSAECLADDVAAVTERLAELVDTQKPHWQNRPDPS